MNKHFVNWKPVPEKDIRGEIFMSRLPQAVDLTLRGRLLVEILTMKKQKQISFTDAMVKLGDHLNEAFDAGRFGDSPGQYRWYAKHFVQWISDLGYHIELTGEEFESYALSDKLA